jgi:hypothetical protein
MFFVVRLQFGRDPLQPFAEDRRRPRIERRKCADHSGLALGHDEFRPRDDEHRRTDDRQSQPFAQDVGNGHGTNFLQTHIGSKKGQSSPKSI